MQPVSLLCVIPTILTIVSEFTYGNPIERSVVAFNPFDLEDGAIDSPFLSVDNDIAAEDYDDLPPLPGEGTDLQYGKCYTLSHSHHGGLGTLPNGIYSFGVGNTDRQFKVCRNTGECKRYGSDQTVRKGSQFYLYDTQGSERQGPGWASLHSWRWLGVYNPNNRPEFYAKFRGKPTCDEGKYENCAICVNLKDNWGGFTGLEVHANKLLYTVRNTARCVTLKFKPVRCHRDDDDVYRVKEGEL
ncbi:hypothetical protein EYZ11_013229 [Aspergillus tanneri]|uniref:Uncharacterized protein n=1 Tax=Aspergillus tanneri TaxID=1220188 RepID=A0A4V3UMH4_9EURO|nr:uncharacterized protein ATNIH1004_010535 [Aspergillus tanneri]KAA8643761.1 hypothetical protein ATNIH1004_010535 [Aspergillus tanneri]THC87324.1 hypothetical protein EYZ11_013229 [Aspergillus tanneri]